MHQNLSHKNHLPTENQIAYDTWIQGKEIMPEGHGSQEYYTQAIKLFEEAVNLDPEFAEAWASLGLAQQNYYWFGYDGKNPGLIPLWPIWKGQKD